MKTKNSTRDLAESKDDKKHLKPDEATLDLPEVKDIPGQEHVHPLPAGEMADTTISSSDEEGEGLLDDDDELVSDDTDVTEEEKELLQESSESMASEDDLKLRDTKLDNTDDDGTELNERIDQSGNDLDIPGEELDDDDEEIGEEDEENNAYSLGGEKEDQNNGNQ